MDTMPIERNRAEATPEITGRPSSNPAFCARLFLWIGMPTLVLLCFLIPPFEAPDEPAHFLRVAALAGGHMLPHVVAHDAAVGGKPSAGGLVDDGAAALVSQVPRPISQTKTNLAAIRALAAQRASGREIYSHHPNTAIYPPFLYAPATLTTAAARMAGLPVLWWFYLGRLANALIGSALISWALRRSGDAAPFLLVVAVLPITLFQVATLSADAVLLPWIIVLCAMLFRIAIDEPPSRMGNVALAIATLLIAVGKVAYLPFAILPAAACFAVDRRWTARVRNYALLAFAAFLLWATWAWVVRDKVYPLTGIPIAPMVQLRHMIASPLRMAGILLHTIRRDLPSMTFGLTGARLGWNELLLPKPFIVAALLVLIAASIPARRRIRVDLLLLWSGLVVVAVSYLAIYLLLYLQFNRLDAPSIEGVQSRYLTPLFVLMLTLTPRMLVRESRMQQVLLLLGMWCGIAALVTVSATLLHYWEW